MMEKKIHSPRIGVVLTVLLVFGLAVVAAHETAHGGHSHSPHQGHQHDHCNHGHDDDDDDDEHEHDHHRHRRHHHHHEHLRSSEPVRRSAAATLPEELAEEEDLRLYGLGGGDHHHQQQQHHYRDHEHRDNVLPDSELSGLGLWIHAMGCSLLVSLASLICLIILPVIFVQGKPSKAVVDSLALFGAGAMLGDAFLHQLPHAFGGEHFHSHDHNLDHAHSHDQSGHVHSHSHSLNDLSVGLSILAGIILFLLVEKLVRYVEDSSGGVNARGHGHRQHQHKKSTKLKAEDGAHENVQGLTEDDKHKTSVETSLEEKVVDGRSSDTLTEEAKKKERSILRKRSKGAAEEKTSLDVTGNGVVANGSNSETDCKVREEAKSSNLVFGYLNLFSDGVHNFTDGMALGNAFLLYGSIGGWSRTLYLLAHELPQEIGDFGILVRSGFTVSTALFFNFLSALVALAGTALALLLGQDPGQSSLMEGFTAGGFIYIAVAGVLAEMHSGSSTLKSTAIQLLSLTMGMAVALWISLIE